MMKTILLFLSAAFLLLLQSCSISTETTLHKNAETSSEYSMDFGELMKMTKSMSDSAKEGSTFGDLAKLPKDWISLYDFEKKEGKKTTVDQDSIRLMKKMFIKANVEEGDLVGFSVRQDHFKAQDYEFLAKGNAKEKLPLNNKLFQSWNGKTLTIDTKNFNNDEFKENATDESESEVSDPSQNMMSQMMKMSFSSVLKFESKIKSVKGLHDWVKKVDDHTIKITYDTDQIQDKNLTLKNKDPQIIITTE